MPCLRHTSATGTPASPSLRIATIWLSLNLLFLIGLFLSAWAAFSVFSCLLGGGNGADGANKANATLYYIDVPNGVTQWTKIKTVEMDFSNRYAGDFSDLKTFDELNKYSNWWYPDKVTRSATPRFDSIMLNGPSPVITFTLPRRKTAPDLSHLVP